HIVLKNAAQKKRAGARAGEREKNAFHWAVFRCPWSRKLLLPDPLFRARTWWCDGDQKLQIHIGHTQARDDAPEKKKMLHNTFSHLLVLRGRRTPATAGDQGRSRDIFCRYRNGDVRRFADVLVVPNNRRIKANG